MEKLSKRWLFVISVAVLATILTAYLLYRSSSTKVGGYTLVTITKGNLESTISTTGTLSPVTQVEVGTQVSGTIDKVLVDFNDHVKKNQIIAIVDDHLLKLAVVDAESGCMKAEAQLEETQSILKQNTELSAKGLLSESELQVVKTTHKIAQASLVSARASLERAQRNLKYAIIRSPIDGTVTTRNVEAGQTVAASFSTPTLFIIAQDLSKMEIKALVDESDIGEIKDGQAVRFTVQAYPNRTFKGVVQQVRFQPTTTSNVVNYTVVVSADNQDHVLFPV